MNLLKKFASVILNVSTAIPFVAPFVGALKSILPQSVINDVNVGVSDISKMASVVTTVEGMTAALNPAGAVLTADQKAAAAKPFIAQVVHEYLSSGALGSAKIKDQAKFDQAIGLYNDATVALLNSLGD